MEISVTITFWLIVQCIGMFIGGQAVHLFLVKIPAIKKRANAANKKFYYGEWWNCDWNIIIGTQVLGAMLIIGLNELVHWKPEILEYVRWFFGGVGAFGSTVVMSKLSNYEKELTRVLDVKSNIADEITGGTKTYNETLEKGSMYTGKDVSKHKPIE